MGSLKGRGGTSLGTGLPSYRLSRPAPPTQPTCKVPSTPPPCAEQLQRPCGMASYIPTASSEVWGQPSKSAALESFRHLEACCIPSSAWHLPMLLTRNPTEDPRPAEP